MNPLGTDLETGGKPFVPLPSARHLFDLSILVPTVQAVGGPAGAARRVGVIGGGTFRGDRLSGVVLPGGADWQTLRSDGALLLDVRVVLQVDDGATVGMTYAGLRHGPPNVMERLARGEEVDPGSYYFRVACTFATSDPRHDRLNRVLAIGTGHRLPNGPVYSVFELA